MDKMSSSDHLQPGAPLSQSEMDEADDLFVSLTFGSGEEKQQSRADLKRWAGTDGRRLAYIAMQVHVDQLIDPHVATLRDRYPRHVTRVPAPTPGRPWARRMYAATGLSLAMVGAVVAINPVVSTQEIHAGIGDQASVELSDGSRVVLNTASSAVFENRIRSRALILLDGELLVSVAGSRYRPFQVFAGAARIRDIGTVFTVRRDAEKVAVAVIEGKVEVSAAAGTAPAFVDARQAAIVYGKTISRVQGGDLYESLVSWKDRRLEFTATPLKKLVEEVQRYRKQRIVFADRRAEAVRVTGGFSSADPDLLLRTLPAVAPVKVQFARNGEVFITSTD